MHKRHCNTKNEEDDVGVEVPELNLHDDIYLFVGSLWPCGPLRSPRVLPPVLLVPLASPVCPPVLLASLLIPPCFLRCPWCLLDPTVV
jgi:hypothetical protein